VKESLQDRILWGIMGAGAITLLVGPWLGGETFDWDGVWEGVSIFAAVALIVILNSGNDYMKDKQFAELYSKIKDEECTVIRGKSGATQSILVEELVVGDCILIEAGSRVSADCILVEGHDVVVNEAYYHGGADHKVPKSACNQETIRSNPDCFLLSQSLTVQGVGKAIVCSVGDYSRRASVPTERLGITDEVTPLQERLTNLGSHFSKFGLYFAAAILVSLVLNWVIVVSASPDATFKEALKKIITAVITALLIIVVAVPEGLPLSIGISLAYSTKQMKAHNILVKRLESMEVMGTVQEIVTGKTGTLTCKDMKVAEWYAMGKCVKNTLKNTMCAYNSGFPERWQEVVKDAIIFNTDARIEMGEEATYVPVGQGTEVCML
jgi:Ca2+-transporting ATPase